ncbi:hypothetical protein APHAL10511_003692 [Amanita phalloides]|nr:hypothetical protein APHAL10511_003692 [Amanita phalloides]
MASQLVIFDFDWSMADQDTDRWIFEVLAIDIRREIENLERQVQWTDLVAQSLRKAHERNITREQIENALRIMPFHPAMVRAVRKLQAGGKTTFLCLSNSNSVFISTILEDKRLTDLFDEIITNPAEWEPSGLLHLRRRIDPNSEQHSCQVGCSANMCKGQELDAYLARRNLHFDRIVYVGDGSNDFCPVLRLRQQDLVLCRNSWGLSKRIAKEGGLKCKVKYWSDAWEVEEIFGDLVNARV